MRIVDLETLAMAPVFDYGSSDASCAAIAAGTGASHVHWLHFEPGGVIGAHPAGFAQLLVPVHGSGWAAGPDGARHPIARGRVAIFEAGETHSKGSATGMSALMIQITALHPEAR